MWYVVSFKFNNFVKKLRLLYFSMLLKSIFCGGNFLRLRGKNLKIEKNRRKTLQLIVGAFRCWEIVFFLAEEIRYRNLGKKMENIEYFLG